MHDTPKTSSKTPLEPDSHPEECTPVGDNHPEEVNHENGNVSNATATSTCRSNRDVCSLRRGGTAIPRFNSEAGLDLLDAKFSKGRAHLGAGAQVQDVNDVTLAKLDIEGEGALGSRREATRHEYVHTQDNHRLRAREPRTPSTA